MLQFDFAPTTGQISYFDPDFPGTRITSGKAWARYRLAHGELCDMPLTGPGASTKKEAITDLHGTGTQWTCTCPTSQDGVELTYQIKSYAQRPFMLLRMGIRNRRREPITLQSLCLLQAGPPGGGSVQLGGPAEDYRFLKVGWHGWDFSGVRRPTDLNRTHWLDRLTSLSYSNPSTLKPQKRGEFASEGWGIFSGRSMAIVAGFVTTASQFGQVHASLRPGSLALMLSTQLDGTRLDPGELRLSEWGYLQYVPLLNAQPESKYVEAVTREMHARLPASPPAPTWTHWYQFYHAIDEGLFLRNVDEIVNRRGDLPFQLVELDDGYQSAWGDWTITNERFPHGLAWLAGEVRKRGLTPGLWLAPFAVQGNSMVARQHPDWLVKDQNGRPARVGFQYNFTTHALDLTHPQVIDHLRKLSHTLTDEFGFEMLKVDFINAAALPGQRHDPKLTRAEALRNGLQAIREGAGEQAFLLGCGCPFGPAIGIVDAMRIGPDTAPSWRPYFNWLQWAGPLIKSNPSMPALRNAVRNTLTLSNLHLKWWWNDPDCLLVRDTDTRLTEAEVQSSISLVGLSDGMLVSSDDLQKVSRRRLQWLARLVPSLGLRGESLDLLQNEMPALYRVSVEHAGQAWQLVALFNWSDKPADLHLVLADVGLGPGTHLHIFDFWCQRYHRLNQPEILFNAVPAHGCKLLRICQVRGFPQLVGDTLHISQGLELDSMRIAEGRLDIQTIDLDRKVTGELWLALPGKPGEVRSNGQIVQVEQKEEGVYALHLEFNGKVAIEVNI